VRINDRLLNPRHAARIFAETAFEGRRQVGTFAPGDPPRFRLVDGRAWYEIFPTSTGWEITEMIQR
jgi:hypothetical protein